MQSRIKTMLLRSAEIKTQIAGAPHLLDKIQQAAEQLLKTVKSGGTVYTCGNGGSACDAMHFVEELVARFKRERPGMRAMHLLDPATMSCWANDYDFETGFQRQVETFCRPGDTLVGFSTSGASKNVINAFKAAGKLGTFRLGLLGKDGGELKNQSDLAIIVPASETERIQECHITLVHIFCELLES